MRFFFGFCVAVLTILLVGSCGICAALDTSINDNDIMPDLDNSITDTNDRANLTTIVGRIIDISCYIDNSSNDWQNKECVVNVLKVGQPAGILEEGTDKLYIVSKTPDHTVNLAAELIPYAAEKVRVKGIVNTRDGINTIDIHEIELAE